MSEYQYTPSPAKIPDTQPAASGGPPDPPPVPPKPTARDLLQPGEPERTVFVPEQISLKALAELLGLKPFRVVADVLALGQFKHAHETIDFETAAIVAKKHGYRAEPII